MTGGSSAGGMFVAAGFTFGGVILALGGDGGFSSIRLRCFLI